MHVMLGCVQKVFWISDIILAMDFVLLTIQSSKKDQWKIGTFIKLHTCKDACLCPVTALGQQIKHIQGKSRVLFQDDSWLLLTCYQPSLPASLFGTHSFWIGTASTAAWLGFSARKMKKVKSFSIFCSLIVG